MPICFIVLSFKTSFLLSHFGSLGYTITGKTADLTVVQKTIIDTLHKEGKPQTFITKEAGCSQSAVSRHVNRKLSGRKKCGRKRCTTNRENRSLMRIVKQNRFKNLGELHKEWTEAGVKASRATTHRRVKEFGYSCRQRRLTWPKEKKNSKSSFQMRASFVFNLETKVLESGGRVEKLIAQVAWSPVLSFHSLWWFGVQCHLLVLVHCVLNWFLNLWVQLMKNGGKNKSVAFIIFFSIWRLSIFSISEICLIELHWLQRLAYISIIFWPQNIFLFCAMTFNLQTNKPHRLFMPDNKTWT